MCGIAGLAALDDRALPDVIEVMTDAIVHRGPDDVGVLREPKVTLGMRRLSIIGLANGHQPIFDESGDVAVVMNGEIYNYRELRRELEERGHTFSTESDAEVAVHLYEERGEDFVEPLRGMFAFALYDRKRGRLLLVRDRFGKKPLYYAIRDRRLVFASEIKAIHASGLIPKEPNPAEIPSYLTHGFVSGTNTLFRDVQKLGPGEALRLEGGEITIRRYWELPSPERTDPGLDAAAEQIATLLEAAVERRLMSEVPLGAFLSGGVDSTAVVAIMRERFDTPVQTFSVGFDEAHLDEAPYARAVAERFGAEHHEVVLRGLSLDLLKAINEAHDEPAGDPACVPTYVLSHFARRRITVALTGEGGDEIFAGYRHYRYARKLAELESLVPGVRALARGLSGLEDTLRPLAPARLWKAVWVASLPYEDRTAAWTSAFTDAELEHLRHHERIAKQREGCGEHEDRLAATLAFEARTILADQLLMKVDKMTMSASLEARCPLLDQDLAEFAARLPSYHKESASGGKIVLRRALARWVPPEVLDRPKQGFDVPLATWLKRDLARVVQTLLLSPEAPVGELVEPAGIHRLWNDLTTRDDERAAFGIWRLLNLAVWQELHWPTGVADDLRRGEVALDDLFEERHP